MRRYDYTVYKKVSATLRPYPVRNEVIFAPTRQSEYVQLTQRRAQSGHSADREIWIARVDEPCLVNRSYQIVFETADRPGDQRFGTLIMATDEQRFIIREEFLDDDSFTFTVAEEELLAHQIYAGPVIQTGYEEEI